jgi:hypothetical protein
MRNKKLLSLANKFFCLLAEDESITPTKELGSKVEPVIITEPKTPKEKKMYEVQQNGERVGKASWQKGNEFVLGNRYRKLQFTPNVAPYRKVDMSSSLAKEKIIEAILEVIMKDNYFLPLRNRPELTKNFIQNLMGMKTAEGSGVNWNFGNIQVGYGKLGSPNEYWKGDVIILGDKNYSGGKTIPYIELYRSYDSLKDGVKDWIYLMKDRGMLPAALQSPNKFYNSLRNKGYFGTEMSKNPVSKHEKAYVGGIKSGIKRNKDLIDKKIEKYYN